LKYDKATEDAKREQAEIRRSRERANLPFAHMDEVIPYPESTGYGDKIRKWSAGYVEALRSGEPYGGLYLWGPSGYGKTFMAANIGKWALSRRLTTQFVDFRRLFDLKLNPAPYDEDLLPGYTVWDSVQGAKVVIIDDVGREANTKYGKNNALTLESIVENRHAAGLVTIMTSVLPPDRIHTVTSRRFEEVVKEACWTMEVSAVDYRTYFNRQRGEL